MDMTRKDLVPTVKRVEQRALDRDGDFAAVLEYLRIRGSAKLQTGVYNKMCRKEARPKSP